MRRVCSFLVAGWSLLGAPTLAEEPAGISPQPQLNHVEQAAAALALGREQEAAELMARHVGLHPGELIVRAQLAELLYRQNSFMKARFHFEHFLAGAQEQPDVAFRYLIHSHSRLVEIGEKLELPYDEHLHRGVGLYLLANRRASEPNPNGEFSVPSLLARSARELQAARQAAPEQARAHFYLARVWRKLDQPAAAAQSLAEADRLAPTSPLTPREQRDLTEAVLAERRFAVKP